MSVLAFGDRALRFALPRGARRRALLRDLAALPGAVDVVLAEDSGCVFFRDSVTSDDWAATTAALVRGLSAEDDAPAARHEIHVVYDGGDLDEVARTLGRSRSDVIALHSGAEYEVAMLGFLPGFAYLTGLPPELRLPRRAPRPRVSPGSVAIAAEYTGIYPFASPGGWHLIGRAPRFVPFTKSIGHSTLAMSDRVRFVPVEEEATIEADARAPILERIVGRSHLEIVRANGFALLVDGGRPGRMHEGVPPGGPLVASALSRANAFAGNDPGACAIELVGTLEVAARGGTIIVADDVNGPVTLAPDERHVVSTEARTRVRYLAVRGGIDAPMMLGGRGALLAAGIGGPLRRGSTLAAATTASTAREAPPPVVASEEPIAVMPGPDADESILEELEVKELRISPTSDRTGTRLEGALGPMTHAMSRRSTPMTVGAIELTPSGLIVLGPDHPTTGGYPVVAIVRSASIDAFMARPVGSTIRFRVA